MNQKYGVIIYQTPKAQNNKYQTISNKILMSNPALSDILGYSKPLSDTDIRQKVFK